MKGTTADEQLIANEAAILKFFEEPNRADLHPMLYRPDARISSLLKRLETHLQAKRPSIGALQTAGKNLESVVYLAFKSLAGVEVLKHYTSAAPQIDLFASGTDLRWQILSRTVFPNQCIAGVLGEAKATRGKANDQVAQRICGLLANQFSKSATIGVVFALAGATGEGASRRALTLHSSRLTRVLFNARQGKPIVVFDWSDIRQLGEAGSLTRMLAQKIQDLELLSSVPAAGFGATVDEGTDLPQHLRELVDLD